MAEANPYTKETTNGARFAGALVNLCTKALRSELQGQVEKSKHGKLQAALNDKDVKSLLNKYHQGTDGKPKILHKEQYNLLYPPRGVEPDIMNCDITLLNLLLKDVLWEIVKPGVPGVGIVPYKHPGSYEEMIKDLNLIRILRNTVYGHVASTEMTNTEFKNKFSILRDILERFDIPTDEINAWENMTLSPDEELEYKNQIDKLCHDDIKFKIVTEEQFHKVAKGNEEIKEKLGKVNQEIKRMRCDLAELKDAKKPRNEKDEEPGPLDYWPHEKKWVTVEESDREDKNDIQYLVLKNPPKNPPDPEDDKYAMICKHRQTSIRFLKMKQDDGKTKQNTFMDTPKDVIFVPDELQTLNNIPCAIKDCIITNLKDLDEEVNSTCNNKDKVLVTYLNSEALSTMNVEQGKLSYLLITILDETNPSGTPEWMLIHSDDRIIGYQFLDEVLNPCTIIETFRKQTQNIGITLCPLGNGTFNSLVKKSNSVSILEEFDKTTIFKERTLVERCEKLIDILKYKEVAKVKKFFKILKHKIETYILACSLELTYNKFEKSETNPPEHTRKQWKKDVSVKMETEDQSIDDTETVNSNRSDYEAQVFKGGEITDVKKGSLVIDVTMHSKWVLANLKRDIKYGMYAMRHCVWLKKQGKPIPQGPITVQFFEAGKEVIKHKSNIAEILAAEEKEIEKERLEQEKENRKESDQADESKSMKETSVAQEKTSAEIEKTAKQLDEVLTLDDVERKGNKQHSNTADADPQDATGSVKEEALISALPKKKADWSSSVTSLMKTVSRGGLFGNVYNPNLSQKEFDESIQPLMSVICAVRYDIPERSSVVTGVFLDFVEPKNLGGSATSPVITGTVAAILIPGHALKKWDPNVQPGKLIFDWNERLGMNIMESSSSGVLAEDEPLDYALLYTSDQNIIAKFQSLPKSPKQMVLTKTPPSSNTTMTLLGHPGNSHMQMSQIQIVDKQNFETKPHLKDFSIIYTSSGLKDTSGAPCFAIMEGQVEFVCIHGGGINNVSDYEFGIKMSNILDDIDKKLPKLGLMWKE